MIINYIVDMVEESVKELEIDDKDTMDIVYRKVAMAEYNNANIPIEIEHLKTRAEGAADGVGKTHRAYVLGRGFGLSREPIKTKIEPTTGAGRASEIFMEGDVINVRRRTLEQRHPSPGRLTLSGGARNYRRKSKSSRRKSSRRKSKRKSKRKSRRKSKRKSSRHR
jgi:hypothetical protein